MKKIILTGGGSAGHVTPNLALIPELKRRDFDVSYICSKDGMEREILEKEGVPMSYFIDTIVISSEAKPGILKALQQKHLCEDTLYMNGAKIREMVQRIKYGDGNGRNDNGKESV